MKQRLALHQGEVRARAPVLLSPPYPGRPRLQAAEQGHARGSEQGHDGGSGRWECPLDGFGGMGQGARGQVPQREDPGVR